jgi:hypothetical protein
MSKKSNKIKWDSMPSPQELINVQPEGGAHLFRKLILTPLKYPKVFK